jgi:hypothetical protein
MTLSAVAGHIGTFPTHLSQIERGLRHDTAFARAAKQLLQEDPLLTA